jgi:dTDP-glucose 4,6-dehydratase
MTKRVLVTGGAGFVGHHFVEHLLKNTGWDIVILDGLVVSGDMNRLTSIDCIHDNFDRVHFVFHDLKAPISEQIANRIGQVDYIFHLAASSHVDRSIEDPLAFVYDNVVGTTNILNYARKLSSLQKFVYFSTDEVFGPAPEGVNYKEWDRYNSGNPYAASKAGGEEMAVAFANTYKLPIIVTHTMNVFGERQNPEKFIPLCIKRILNNEKIYIHANKTKTKSGSRYYIHARNVSDALLFLIEKGERLDGSGTRGKYNIRGEKEVSNLDLALLIGKIMGKPVNYELVDFHSSRPGHDLRYALDGSLMESIGWKLPVVFEDSLAKVINWTLNHREWL